MYPRYYLSAAAANNKIYVVGGNNNGIYLKTNEEYTLADVQTFYIHRKN